MMNWFKKMFMGGKKEMGAAAPMSAPKAAEMPMGSMPEKKETMTGGEMKDEAQSEDMK